METIVVHPENEAQLTALKAFMEEQNINFEIEQNEIPESVLNGIELSREEASEGKLVQFISVGKMLKP